MFSNRLVATAFSAFSVFVLPGTAMGNALSDAYSQAFLEPRQFEMFLLNKVTSDSSYYKRFDACFKLAMPTLHTAEKQSRDRHKSCSNNQECSLIAKDIQTFINLRSKVGDLNKYIRATQQKPVPNFLDSDIGRMALAVHDFHRDRGIDLRRNPELLREFKFLSGLPCP